MSVSATPTEHQLEHLAGCWQTPRRVAALSSERWPGAAAAAVLVGFKQQQRG
jgi:hypothetical protein